MNAKRLNYPHDHDFLSPRQGRNERRTWIVIALTLATMVVEIFSGLVFGSMALLADGWHMASHASALGITALAYYLARKHRRNARFTFGTGKIGELAGFSSALLLAVVALSMAYASIHRLLHPVAIHFDEAILVAVIGLIVNVASALLLKEHHSHDHDQASGVHGHHHHHDHNLRAAYLHVLADALTSILAITALLFGKYQGWGFLDPVMGIVGAAVISRWSYSLMRETGKVLLDYSSPNAVQEEIRRVVASVQGAVLLDLHVWRIGPGAYSAIVALSVRNAANPAQLRKRLCTIRQLSHVTIEINPPEYGKRVAATAYAAEGKHSPCKLTEQGEKTS
jgi:cation diffusion facilitator family transporter